VRGEGSFFTLCKSEYFSKNALLYLRASWLGLVVGGWCSVCWLGWGGLDCMCFCLWVWMCAVVVLGVLRGYWVFRGYWYTLGRPAKRHSALPCPPAAGNWREFGIFRLILFLVLSRTFSTRIQDSRLESSNPVSSPEKPQAASKHVALQKPNPLQHHQLPTERPNPIQSTHTHTESNGHHHCLPHKMHFFCANGTPLFKKHKAENNKCQ